MRSWRILLILLPVLFLTGCPTFFKTKPHAKNVGEAAPLLEAGKKTDEATATADDKNRKVEKKDTERDSKVKADITSARTANQDNPPGVPQAIVDATLEVAQARLDDVKEDAATMAENAKIAALFSAGKAEEARSATAVAVGEAKKTAEELGALKLERDQAITDRDEARELERSSRESYIEQMRLNKIAADNKLQQELDKQKKEFQRNMGYALIAGGMLLLVIGILDAYAKFKTGDIFNAAIAGAFWGGGAGFCFTAAWAINQPWFKWFVIIGTSLGITAVVVYCIMVHGDVKKKKQRLVEADEAEETLLEVQDVLDKELPKDHPIFQKLTGKLDRKHKALLNELKAEQQRAT